MDSKFKYQRSFFIFDEEDSGFGTEQKPSGHVKIEIKEGKGKLFCQVSGLSDDNGKIQYKLFLIKSDEYKAVPVLVGNIELKRDRGDLEWSFDPYNINKTNFSIDKFNVIAVLANYTDRENNYVICPLAAYKNGKVEWRQQLSKVLQQEKSNVEVLNQIQENDDIANKISNDNFEDVNKKEETIKNEQSEAGNGEITSEENNSTDKQQQDNFLEIKTETENEPKLDIEDSIEPVENSLEKNKSNTESNPVEEFTKVETVEKESIEEIAEEKTSQENTLEENIIQENITQEKQKEEKKVQSTGKSYSSYNGSKLFDLYNDNANDNMNLNTNCVNCIFSNNKKTDKPQIKEFNSEELRRQLDSTFERYSPFLVKRTDYIWWKVTSPVHLNNILYSFGIQIPFLFNPLVLIAHNKYNHLIVGIYRDDIRQKDYIVCGVPGVYWVDEKPFGNACRWAQVEGNTPTYGAFGYWIVYINPKTGKVLAIDE